MMGHKNTLLLRVVYRQNLDLRLRKTGALSEREGEGSREGEERGGRGEGRRERGWEKRESSREGGGKMEWEI